MWWTFELKSLIGQEGRAAIYRADAVFLLEKTKSVISKTGSRTLCDKYDDLRAVLIVRIVVFRIMRKKGRRTALEIRVKEADRHGRPYLCYHSSMVNVQD